MWYEQQKLVVNKVRHRYFRESFTKPHWVTLKRLGYAEDVAVTTEEYKRYVDVALTNFNRNEIMNSEWSMLESPPQWVDDDTIRQAIAIIAVKTSSRGAVRADGIKMSTWAVLFTQRPTMALYIAQVMLDTGQLSGNSLASNDPLPRFLALFCL